MWIIKLFLKKFTDKQELLILHPFYCSPHPNSLSILPYSACSPGTWCYGLYQQAPLCKRSNNLLSKLEHFWERRMEMNKLSWANQGSWFCWGLVPAAQVGCITLLRATAPARQRSPCCCLSGFQAPPLSLPFSPRSGNGMLPWPPAPVLHGPTGFLKPCPCLFLKLPPFSVAVGHLFPASTLLIQNSR